MFEVKDTTHELNGADISEFAIQAQETETDAPEVKAVGRTAKKCRSEATLNARLRLKKAISKEMKRQGVSVADFAEQQGNKRQYIYRALSMKDDAASIDQLVGFAGDLGINIDIQVS